MSIEPTVEQLQALSAEAMVNQNTLLVMVCQHALGGDPQARKICNAVIAERDLVRRLERLESIVFGPRDDQ